MNFRPELARAVMEGRKTVTRRLANDNPRSPWFKGGCALRVDHSYAVCPGRGKNAIGRVRIVEVTREPLGLMTELEAVREGFADLDEFIEAWADINGAYDPDTLVWRVEFAAISPEDDGLWERSLTAAAAQQAAAFTPGAFHIETASGRFFDLSRPDPADVLLADVAAGLSKTCRFGGHCSRFLSVAEHAVNVSRRLRAQRASRDIVLAGLHHDDAEAYIGDVTRPLKQLVPQFKAVERAVMAAVIPALGLEGLPFDAPEVKAADDWALAMEAYWLMPSRGAHWYTAGLYTRRQPCRLGLDADEAARLWLRTHDALTQERRFVW